MKIRTGFVSNSSSSSFIVVFDKKPENAKELRDMMFGSQILFDHPYEDITYSTEEIAEHVFNEIKEVSSNIEELSPEFAYDSPVNIDNFKDKDNSIDWDKYQEARQKVSDKQSKNFIKEHKDKFIGVFEYSDNNNDFETALEHGDIFSNLENIRISKH